MSKLFLVSHLMGRCRRRCKAWNAPACELTRLAPVAVLAGFVNRI